jgi:hypothetical protein
MSHDASKVVMGNITSSFKVVDNRAGSIEAGLIVRLKSDDTISIASADGLPLGISVGKDLSDTARTAVVRKGSKVPIKLTADFEPVIGAQVYISDTTGLGIASGAGTTGMNATWVSTRKTAILEDGTEVANIVALADMPGGL